MGSRAFCFGGLSRPEFSDSDWFVLDLELTLKNFCVRELMKNKDLDVAKLLPGLRRNFIQQEQEDTDPELNSDLSTCRTKLGENSTLVN